MFFLIKACFQLSFNLFRYITLEHIENISEPSKLKNFGKEKIFQAKTTRLFNIRYFFLKSTRNVTLLSTSYFSKIHLVFSNFVLKNF